MIGVSPAFYISAYGRDFGPGGIAASIPRIAALGFDAIQLEVFGREGLSSWTEAAMADIRARLEGEGLAVTQFVGHFLLDGFSRAGALSPGSWEEDLATFLDIAAAFPACGIVTIPIPPFAVDTALSPGTLGDLRKKLCDRLSLAVYAARSQGKRLALEIMPLSIVGGTEGFIRLCEEPGLEDLAYNFDTGHAWARKERVELIPAALGGRLAGTHLCDNSGNENHKLVPGDGSLDFPALFRALAASGYGGSFDVEVLCDPAAVDDEYRRARQGIERAAIAAQQDLVRAEG